MNGAENKIKANVQQKFAEIRAALHMREKLLLRQVDHLQQYHLQQQLCNVTSKVGSQDGTARSDRKNCVNEVNFLAERENELLAVIRTFGRFQIDNISLTLQDIYLKNEDYIAPDNDHETMYKCLESNQSRQCNQQQLTASDLVSEDDDDDAPKTIIVDFSRNKSLIEHNVKNMNESIINITLQEAKELINRARLRRETPIPLLNLEELDDELESSIADAVSALAKEEASSLSLESASSRNCKASHAKAKCIDKLFKPKITINNCNGIIKFRNISNLTINCSSEDSISACIPTKPTVQHADNRHEKLEQFDENENRPNGNKQASQPAQHYPDFVCNNNNFDGGYCEHSKHRIVNSAQEKIVYESDSNVAETQSSTTETTSTAGDTTPKSATATSNSCSNSCIDLAAGSFNSQHRRIVDSTKSGQPLTSTTLSLAYPYGFVEYDDNDENNCGHFGQTCDFYNRLLNEIKKTLKTKQKYQPNFQHSRLSAENEETVNTQSGGAAASGNRHINNSSDSSPTQPKKAEASAASCNGLPSEVTPCSVTSEIEIDMGSGTISTPATINTTTTKATTASQNLQSGRRLVLKNFENLRIILEASSSDEEKFHPVQIEQWLAEIISETDLEPVQGSDILEHSRIDTESSV